MSLSRRSLSWSAALVLAVSLTGCSQPGSPAEPAAAPVEPDASTTASDSPTATDSPTPTPTARETPSASASPTPTARPTGKPKAKDVVTGLTSPWAIVPLRDGSMLVCERDTGIIKRVVGSKASDVRAISEVEPGGEGGLLGLAASRDEKMIFAYYTAAQDNRIVAMTWNGSRLGEPRVILDGIPKGLRHNGGRMVIGPDDHLYVGTGEVGDTSLAQDRDSLAGKILRITQSGDPVKDNPFNNEVYSYGHRNVQGLAFDADDRLWASEFGEQSWDELNLVRKGSNYGWPNVEGIGEAEGMTNPKVVWRTDEASPSGLAYWRGSLYMAALRGERLWEIPVNGADAGKPEGHFTADYGRLRSVTVAIDGNGLLVSTSNTDGRADPRDGDDRILRITR